MRANLLMGHTERAHEFAAQLQQEHPRAETLLRLGNAYGEAEQPAAARDYYQRASELGFYPEAHVGMARAAYDTKDHEAARAHLQAALDLTRPVGDDAAPPLAFLEHILAGLRAPNELVSEYDAWIATLDLRATNAALPRLKLLVCATTFEEAQAQVRWLHSAMLPTASLLDSSVAYERPGEHEQPQGPILLGMYLHQFE